MNNNIYSSNRDNRVNNQTGGGSDYRENRQDGNNNSNTMINDQTGGDKPKTVVTLPKIKESLDNIEKKIDNLKFASADSSSLKPIEEKIDMVLKRLDQLFAE